MYVLSHPRPGGGATRPGTVTAVPFASATTLPLLELSNSGERSEGTRVAKGALARPPSACRHQGARGSLNANVPRDWLVPLCLRHIVVVVDDVGMKTRNGRPSGHLSKLMPTRFCESRERHASIWLLRQTPTVHVTDASARYVWRRGRLWSRDGKHPS